MAPKMKRKGLEPSLDLPSLFPTHDGSYGVNTLLSNAEAKKGQKPNNGIAEEQADDRKWIKSMKSHVAKKYGMNSNLRKAIIESHEQVEKEHQAQTPHSPNVAHISNENAASSSEPFESSESSGHSGSSGSPGFPGSSESSGPLPDPGKASEHQDGLNAKPAPHVPNYDAIHPPFLERYHDQPQPPYTRAEIPSYALNAPVGMSQTSAPPAEHVPFYGMPNGKGSMEPISPMRPDTPRSFNDESRLFSDAILQTPAQTVDILDLPPIRPQGLGLALPNQQTRWFGSTGVSGVDGQLKGQPASGVQSNNARGQTVTGQPATDRPALAQPVSGQPATGQPLLVPTPTSGQPTSYGQLNTSQPPESPNTPRGPKVPKVKKTLKIGTPKQGLKSQAQQSSSKPPSRVAKALQQRPPVNRSEEDRRYGWIWPSSDLLITSLVMFSALVLAVWAALSAIPIDFSDSDMVLSRVNLGFSNFGIGTMWETISNLLPEIPDIESIRQGNLHNIPGAPGRSDYKDVDYENSLADLKKSIPDTVWVQKDKDGKVKISEDFWHAFKEMNKRDNILDRGNSNLSDELWNAIKSRIRSDGIDLGTGYSDDSYVSKGDIMDLVDKKVSQSWESWLKQNDQALKKALTGATLTKDEFMKLFQQEAASHKHEIQEEFTELQGRIKVLTQQLSRLQDEFSAGHSMSAHEINEAIGTIVSKAITNAKLDAIAQGHIKGHANDVLANQVNFFSHGAGGTIDPNLSSTSWKFPKEPINSKKYLDRSTDRSYPPQMALLPWSQEGECFCAAPDRNGYGQGTNNISVLISRNIIPQHLVVEHILPGATLDPGAMPKEIEVWAYFEVINLRNELQAFSETQFPDTPREQVLNDGYVKIGHFTYEKKHYGDGVQVFKISDELSRMRAITNHIVVRALNNYGADHTCFYQLKMYGEVVERPDDQPAHR